MVWHNCQKSLNLKGLGLFAIFQQALLKLYITRDQFSFSNLLLVSFYRFFLSTKKFLFLSQVYLICLAWDQIWGLKWILNCFGNFLFNKESVACTIYVSKHKICVLKNSLQIWTYTCTTYYYVLQFPICQKILYYSIRVITLFSH